MIVYHYHVDTGEYLGYSLADESPLEPGVYLLPANSVLEPPPEPEHGFAVAFEDGAWGLRPAVLPVNTLPEPEPWQPVDPLSLPMDRLNFWLAAASVGVSKFSVRAHIESMPEGIEKCEAIAWFEEAKQYRRQDPLLVSLAAAEGITETQLDALWVWAANPS